jgi:hypothetical protein
MTRSSRPTSRQLVALALSGLVSVPLAASAQQPARDPAGAEKLYDDASALLSKGDWSGACPMFEQSHKLDPSPGALLNLAGCAEHDGRVATAWSLLRDARSLNADTASAKRRDEIERFVAAGLARLEPRIPTLAIHVASPPPELRVLRDGQDVTASLDKALPVDPGEHVIEVSAPGHLPSERRVSVAEATHPEIEIALERDASSHEPKVEPGTPPVRALPQHEPPPPRDDGGGMGGAQIAGLVVGSAGVASLAVSIVTGVMASGKKSDLDALGCSDKPGTDGGTVLCAPGDVSDAKDLSSSGSTLATVSTVTTFAGVGLVGAGVVLFVVGSLDGPSQRPSQARVLPVVGPGVLGLSVMGTL